MERAGRSGGPDRRAWLKGMIGLAAGLSASVGAGPVLYGQAGRGGRGGRGAAQAEPGTTLVLLGTQGGPTVSATWTQSGSAVLVDGRPYLVDCGYGTVRALVEAGIRFAGVGNVFLTHLHDDHTADIAALLALQWTSSANPQPTDVWGPYGSQAMVEAAIAFFRANVEIRMVDEGREVRPETIFAGHDLLAPEVTEVFQDDRVMVQAVENAHFPDRAKAQMPYRSFAYRFNTAERSIVFSGDTAYSTNLIELARGADVFVCESMTMATQQRFQSQGGLDQGESIARHVLETHVSTEDVGRMASEAGVGTVVLSHHLPGARPDGTVDATYVEEVGRHFDGEVIVGQDQLRF